MAKHVSRAKLPITDSIQELAQFWDSHDLTAFEDELEEVTEPVFQRKATVTVELDPDEARALDELAQSEGIDAIALIRKWIRERIPAG